MSFSFSQSYRFLDHFRIKGNAPALLASFLIILSLSACSSGKQEGMSQSGALMKKSEAQKKWPGQPVAPMYTPSPYAPPSKTPPRPPLTVDNGNAQMAMAGQKPPSAIASGGKTQVALLLPLSGKNAPIGQAMLNAAQLAVFDIAPGNFELMPRDTGGKPESAAQAASEAIAGGARLLIGPLFAQDVKAVKPVVQTSNVNMLALSTDVALAEPGVYVMGFVPSPQVERVVAYAAQQGAKSFAAVIPPGAYGKLVQKAFEDSVQKHGGMVVGIHSPSQIATLGEKKDQLDALLLPLGGEELRNVAAQLAAAGFDRNKTRMLGTGLWDEPNLGSRSEILVGGWFPAAEPEVRENFIANYRKNYGQDPPRLATLTYDATALAAVLAAREGNFDRAALTNPSGFAGLDGIFRLTSTGQAERGLAIIEVTLTGNKVVDPSPSVFAATTR